MTNPWILLLSNGGKFIRNAFPSQKSFFMEPPRFVTGMAPRKFQSDSRRILFVTHLRFSNVCCPLRGVATSRVARAHLDGCGAASPGRDTNAGRRRAVSAATTDRARYLHEFQRHGGTLASHVLQRRERGRALRALPRNDPDLKSGKLHLDRSRLRGNARRVSAIGR